MTYGDTKLDYQISLIFSFLLTTQARPHGWKPVSEEAVKTAACLLYRLHIYWNLPDRVVVTADGGIAFYYDRAEGGFATFEIFDDGEIVAGYSDRVNQPEAWEMNMFSDNFRRSISALERFLR